MLRLICLIIFCCIGNSALAINNDTCDIIPGKKLDSGRFGPYDYTDPQHQKFRPTVEDHHFTREVETLRNGIGAPTPAGDIQYTLRKFPNHHRALYSMLRLQSTMTKWKYVASKSMYTMECFFKRAHYFRRDDPVIYMLQGMYYYNIKNYNEAEKHYLKSLALQPENPELNYNLGLLYIEMNDLQRANKHAKIAYDIGYPLQGLKNKLSQGK